MRVDWHKSSYSNQQGGDCVEVAETYDSSVLIRDTQNRPLGHLAFPHAEFGAFLAGVRTGEL
ncbi:DUF397 domain-containing protein [Spiractinospora alimapuensis]|uniref:DUF397 domain-containing protein n=1 Tax=Spiractinospora alimapuensis TaxID=2820884 RepID=UPI001F186F6B|nr:DUF397 domain-containing protein [Spiractinospora alimapuensis]QVQ50677.1 DUF397 domain-containing protein [Spiractinospora alimapuensis]